VASFITTDEQLQKTEAAVFSRRLCFLRAFPFISFLLLQHVYIVFVYNFIVLYLRNAHSQNKLFQYSISASCVWTPGVVNFVFG